MSQRKHYIGAMSIPLVWCVFSLGERCPNRTSRCKWAAAGATAASEQAVSCGEHLGSALCISIRAGVLWHVGGPPRYRVVSGSPAPTIRGFTSNTLHAGPLCHHCLPDIGNPLRSISDRHAPAGLYDWGERGDGCPGPLEQSPNLLSASPAAAERVVALWAAHGRPGWCTPSFCCRLGTFCDGTKLHVVIHEGCNGSSSGGKRGWLAVGAARAGREQLLVLSW